MDDVVVVDDEDIAEAMVLLLERGKFVTEGAGAAGVAALLAGAWTRRPRARPSRSYPVEAASPAHVPDRSGGLAGLLQVVGDAGGNVLDVVHVRDGVMQGLTSAPHTAQRRGRDREQGRGMSLARLNFLL